MECSGMSQSSKFVNLYKYWSMSFSWAFFIFFFEIHLWTQSLFQLFGLVVPEATSTQKLSSIDSFAESILRYWSRKQRPCLLRYIYHEDAI